MEGAQNWKNKEGKRSERDWKIKRSSDQIDEGGQDAGDNHHSQPDFVKIWSQVKVLYCPPEVAEEYEGDGSNGDETEGEVPPQLHGDDLVRLPSLVDLKQHNDCMKSFHENEKFTPILEGI